jgi:hypothetical protein
MGLGLRGKMVLVIGGSAGIDRFLTRCWPGHRTINRCIICYLLEPWRI